MIVVFGSINFDFLLTVASLPTAGGTVLAERCALQPGGKGANQAVAAARDGADVIFAGAVGQDALADAVLANFAPCGIDFSRVVRVAAPTGCASVAVDREGHNQIIVAQGANLLARESQIEGCLLGAGTTLLLQMETDPTEVAALIRRARSLGARIILNLAPAMPLPMAALQAVDILAVNETEAEWLGGHLGVGRDAAALHGALGVTVVRTLGSAGVEAMNGDGLIRLPACDVDVVDTTAAGDCFAGVLAAALDRGAGWADALRRANLAAALCCTRAGSQDSLPTKKVILNQSVKGTIREWP
jgi:ribokinase